MRLIALRALVALTSPLFAAIESSLGRVGPAGATRGPLLLSASVIDNVTGDAVFIPAQ